MPEVVICPYCSKQATYVNSYTVYGADYGMVYLCKGCDAYTGCKTGTDKPLGRLANKELRNKKKEAHKYFDAIWKEKLKRRRIERGEEYQEIYARSSGYKWLSTQLNITFKECNLGLFDIDMCQKVVDICKPYANKLGVS